MLSKILGFLEEKNLSVYKYVYVLLCIILYIYIYIYRILVGRLNCWIYGNVTKLLIMQEILASNKIKNIHYTPAVNSWKQAIGKYIKVGCYLKIIQNPLSSIWLLSAINDSILIIRLEKMIKKIMKIKAQSQ
jgi:hypothetical protein